MKISSRIIRWGVAVWLSCGFLSHAFSAESVKKLGFINTERVYQESRQAQNIQQTLEKEFRARYQALQKLQEDGENIEQQLSSGNLKGKQREAAIKNLDKLVQTYRIQQARLAEEYNLRRNEEFAALQQNANKVIIDLAKKEGYDLIIQDVVFVNAKFDITDKVIKALNKQ